MSITGLTAAVVTVLGFAQPQNPTVQPSRGRLPAPPPTTVTRQVTETKQVMEKQKQVIEECVLVCPPGLFRRPYYVVQRRTVEVQVPKTVSETRSVTDTIEFNGIDVNGTATIINLPKLSSGQIRDVFDRVRLIMISKKMLPSNGNFDPRQDKDIPASNLNLETATFQITSIVFDFSSEPSKEFQMFVQSAVTRDPMSPTTNQVSFRVDVRERTKGSKIELFNKSDLGVARAILADLFKDFDYTVTPN